MPFSSNADRIIGPNAGDLSHRPIPHLNFAVAAQQKYADGKVAQCLLVLTSADTSARQNEKK